MLYATYRKPERRKALVAEGIAAAPECKTFIYVNNRLEGNALETIDEMLKRMTIQEAAGTFTFGERVILELSAQPLSRILTVWGEDPIEIKAAIY